MTYGVDGTCLVICGVFSWLDTSTDCLCNLVPTGVCNKTSISKRSIREVNVHTADICCTSHKECVLPLHVISNPRIFATDELPFFMS